ncbi:MAG TPA: S-methyl-5-thioribose-1-phosphate isomerase [Rhizomicrobium sp.]|jgi:methylthioribose-1-phosphate isomerase|nr:S-methyl-5-thioribose-1-phosphate isomerase [Rhizomicrobium sp.]
MKIAGRAYRTIWTVGDDTVEVIDQTRLPFQFATVPLKMAEDAAEAIRNMVVRGAPLIGATAAYGIALAMRDDASDENLDRACDLLIATRPTAVNLRWALERMRAALRNRARPERPSLAWKEAAAIADQDVETCRRIGERGLGILRELAAKKHGAPLNVLTHCNAGWLACVDWGTALAPIYMAHDAGVPVHVWVDETRPRNQGASLTAFELGSHGVPHTIIADNAGGHYMQGGTVDCCIVGTDRVAANGDVANKIGTYLKALAARDNNVPFYVALPGSTIDWSTGRGEHIPIEERAADELTHIAGRLASGAMARVEIAAPGSSAANPAFDVTPARLVTSLITERGTCAASRDGLLSLYPEHRLPETP